MSEENNNQNEADARDKMKEQFINSLLNSDLDKKIVSKILSDDVNFWVFFHVFLLGCQNMKDITIQLTQQYEELFNSNQQNEEDDNEQE